jgi:hypothetical protein
MAIVQVNREHKDLKGTNAEISAKRAERGHILEISAQSRMSEETNSITGWQHQLVKQGYSYGRAKFLVLHLQGLAQNWCPCASEKG